MLRTVVLFLLSSLAILLLAAPQSRGDGVDTFTFIEVGGGIVVSETWQSLATPHTSGNFSAGIGFLLPAVPVDFFVYGLPFQSGPVDLRFYSSLYSQTSSTGELFDAGGLFGLDGTDQLYGGSEGSPTFLSGTYTGTDPYSGGTATLVISAPEPSSLLLLFSALLSIAGVLFVQKLQL
jgi:hypothetical protein